MSYPPKQARRINDRRHGPVLKHTRCCLLKRPTNLSNNHRGPLRELLPINLRTVPAHILAEEFALLWTYNTPYWAGRFLAASCRRVLGSRIEPLKQIARSVRGHPPLILGCLRARNHHAAAAVQGLNNKLKLVKRTPYSLYAFRVADIALYHTLGDLPVPTTTHTSC